MKTRALIIVMLFLVWSFGSVYWYLCTIKGLCFEEEVLIETALKPIIKEEQGNLTFTKNRDIPELNNQSTLVFDSLKNLSANALLIKGYYLKGEPEELGINRAKSIKKILLAHGFDRQINVQAGFMDKLPSGKFNASEFILLNEVVEETQEENDFNIEKLKDKMVIYFPVASADPHTNINLTNELKIFAQSVITQKRKISIIGHTDNSGTHEVNLQYGLLRANAIKNLLIEYGVSPEALNATSQGESEPIADNLTISGKKKNRRVEMKILIDQ